MTRLAIIFSLLFVTPAWAETMHMRCDFTLTVGMIHFKYEQGIFFDSCYLYHAGEYTKWAKAKNLYCSNSSGKNWVDFNTRTAQVQNWKSSATRCQHKLKSGEWAW